MTNESVAGASQLIPVIVVAQDTRSQKSDIPEFLCKKLDLFTHRKI